MELNLNKTIFKKAFFAIAFLFYSVSVFSEVEYTEIDSLTSRNKTFAEYAKKVEKAYMAIVRQEEELIPEFYVYYPSGNDTLIRIAARCNIPYETIASLNRIPNIETGIKGKKLYLPTIPGLFISSKPSNTFEIMIGQKKFDINSVNSYTTENGSFYFLPNEKITPTERLYFLDSSLISPLPEGILTSQFGMRQDPFGGKDHFHDGIDLAAPIGTMVRACKEGNVKETGFNDLFGKYILIQHSDGMQSLYGHLSKINVSQGIRVAKGEKVGEVGTTGRSTGPHLHFTIKQNGNLKDPENYIKVKH